MRLGIVYHMPFWRAADGTLRELEGSFARYVDSLAPYFDEISLCVPTLEKPSGEGTAIRASNVTIASMPSFEGPAQFYPKLPVILPKLAGWVHGLDVLHCRVPTPAAICAFLFARLLGRPAFVLVVGDLAALRDSAPYRGLKKIVWRCYTEFEERAMQWMADHSLAFANGGALTKSIRVPTIPSFKRRRPISASDIATRGYVPRDARSYSDGEPVGSTKGPAGASGCDRPARRARHRRDDRHRRSVNRPPGR
jgi:hypothetical protein